MGSVNEGIVIFNTDFRVLLWNRFMEELTGVPAGEVVGEIVTDYSPYIKETFIKNDLQRVLEGESFTSGEVTFDFPRSGRSGWLIGLNTPLKNSENNIIGIIISIRDITRRKMVELSLGKTQKISGKPWMQPPTGSGPGMSGPMSCITAPGSIPCSVTSREFPAKFTEYRKLIHPDDLHQTMVIVRDYMNSKDKDCYENEYRLKTKSGEYRWIYAKARVVAREKDGRSAHDRQS